MPRIPKRRLGILDLGSNSVRLMIADLTPGYAFKIVDELSRRVRLSEGMSADDRLQPGAITRAVTAVRAFRDYGEAHGVGRILAVATEAVRSAANRMEFLARVRQATGIDFHVISGEEEARLGVLAAINSLDWRAGLALEVGGGSAQVSMVRGRRFRRGGSLPLGAVRLTELFLPSDPVPEAEAARLDAHIAHVLSGLDWMTIAPGAQMVGMGGTIRALARIDLDGRNYPLNLIHGYELERARMEALIKKMRALPIHERVQRVPGLLPERADIILAGAMVVAGAMRRAGAERLVVCNAGLRESLIWREFIRSADAPVVRNLRQFDVLNLGRVYGVDTAHAAHVARLALSLFDQLAPLHRGGESERDCVWAAAQLHDLGKTVDYFDYARHSAYIILNAGLRGYSHREIAFIGLLCRHLHSGQPDPAPYAGVLQPADAERLDRLVVLLRLAECLDRVRTQSVSALRVRVAQGAVHVRVKARRRAMAQQEVQGAQRTSESFEAAFGRALRLKM